MINRVVLVGRITKDIDLKKTPNGASVVQFTLAVSRKIKAKGQPEADFINCISWNNVADLMKQYLHKGSLIGVEGRIQTRSYDDKDGKKIYVTEVVGESVHFLEPKQNNETPSQNNNTDGSQLQDGEAAFDINSLNDPEDEEAWQQGIENAPNITWTDEEYNEFVNSKATLSSGLSHSILTASLKLPDTISKYF